MHPLVKKYGKQFMKDLLDMIFITKNSYINIRRFDVRDFMLKYKLITRNTKTALCKISKHRNYHYTYYVDVYNGRNTNILHIQFPETEISQILEDIKGE